MEIDYLINEIMLIFLISYFLSSSVVFLPDLKCFRDEITTSEHISSRKDLADYKKQLEKEYPEVDISVLESPNLVSFCELLEKLSELKSIPELELIL